jgi:hypothetical protein
LPTAEERRAEEEREQEQQKYEIENAFKERQIKASESANNLARTNRNLTVCVIILSAVTAGASLYQGRMNRNSWVTANSTLGQMQADSAASSRQFQTQLGHFDDGLGRTGLLAIHAGEQAKAGQDAADTAKRAANIADSTLHIAERAYVFAGTMYPDFTRLAGVRVPLINGGHIPSGPVDIVLYEWSIPMVPMDQIPKPESHEQHEHFATLPPGQAFGVIALIPGLTQDTFSDYMKNREPFIVAGTISYNNGFPKTPEQESRFCFEDAPDPMLRQSIMIPCDPDVEIPKLKASSAGRQM